MEWFYLSYCYFFGFYFLLKLGVFIFFFIKSWFHSTNEIPTELKTQFSFSHSFFLSSLYIHHKIYFIIFAMTIVESNRIVSFARCLFISFKLIIFVDLYFHCFRPNWISSFENVTPIQHLLQHFSRSCSEFAYQDHHQIDVPAISTEIKHYKQFNYWNEKRERLKTRRKMKIVHTSS